jgi:Ricin-type beta-trefoil lectin domain
MRIPGLRISMPFGDPEYYGECLDGNDTGSTAGQDGDKVQLWDCKNTNNQYWIPADHEADGDAYTVLVNGDYQSMCLNAVDNGGLADGRKVQPWNCDVDTANGFWDFGDWYVGNTPYLILDNSPTTFVLDATSQDLGEGDQIQIYTEMAAATRNGTRDC